MSEESPQKVTLVRAVQTAMACPSQWDAWDADGNYYYLRYRSGYGEIRQYQTANWVDAPWDESVDKTQPGWGIRANTEFIRTVATFEYGHPLDGMISLEKFAELAGIDLVPDIERTAFWRDTKEKLAAHFQDDEAALHQVEKFFENIDLDQE